MRINQQTAQAYRDGYESGWRDALTVGRKHRFTGTRTPFDTRALERATKALEAAKEAQRRQRERPVHQHLEVHQHHTTVVAAAGAQVLLAQNDPRRLEASSRRRAIPQ